MAHSARRARLASENGTARRKAGLVCHDLRQRDRQCRQVQSRTLCGKGDFLHGYGADRYAGELHCDVLRAAGGRSAGNRRQSRAQHRPSNCGDSAQSAVRADAEQSLRPLHERTGQSDFLQVLRQSGRLCRVKRLYRLRAVCEALSDEQRCNQRRQAGLGQELHPLHGVHLLLPGQRDRVRQKERRSAEVSL